LVVDPDAYRAAYDVISNGTLWFLHHGLYDAPRRPRFDRHWRAAWDAYREVNAAFADAVVEDAPEDAVVVVHDYHLSLLGRDLAAKRPDLSAVHFTHTPFCSPDTLRMLPGDVAAELLAGLDGFHACGFHASRWARAFGDCCQEVLGHEPTTFVSPAAVDAEDLAATVRSDRCVRALTELDRQVGDRALIVRVDRIELSKNLLRGFLAFEDLLRHHPEWRERVVFGAFVYPSREGLIEYQAYRLEVEGLVQRINAEWSTPGWTPILWDASDDYPRSVAALRRFDVLLVNPVRDGLNLVAKEGMAVNERSGVLALSQEAGVWEELGDVALAVNPFDVSGTADVLHTALSMGVGQRQDHGRAVRKVVGARSPTMWFADQLAAAGS
ncbi:MAG: trehalose-6-phosphate synthase, partial [Actinomycetota bacterium]|nr:trehalose-6-phosphate synthase [Actinomycetota bacterium]